MPASDRLTRSTCCACSSIDKLRCSTPSPPCRAIAIAIRASVTVSIAADTSGIAHRDVARQARGGVGLAGIDVGLAGQQQDVVIGEPEGGERVLLVEQITHGGVASRSHGASAAPDGFSRS